MSKNIISTPKAPGAIGPYSQAVWAGNMLYASGQIPLNPQTGEIVSQDVKEQTHQSIKNAAAILEAAGLTLKDVFKTTVFIKDMNDFTSINEVYAQYFEAPFPARSCVEVARLPKGVKVEVEIIALKQG